MGGTDKVKGMESSVSPESSTNHSYGDQEDVGLDSRTRRRVREAKSKARPGTNYT